MSDRSPSEVLLAAADRVRDLAARAVIGPWYPSAGGQVRAGRDEEHYVATATTTPTAQWIAALSPAIAPAVERILRDAAKDWQVRSRIFTAESMEEDKSSRRFAGALALAEAILGSGVVSP